MVRGDVDMSRSSLTREWPSRVSTRVTWDPWSRDRLCHTRFAASR
jgi:hypothetical protein